jgi:elongation factor G
VQLLLDGVIKYLPSPLERGPLEIKHNDKVIIRQPKLNEKLCVYAFKVINDNDHGLITFVRTYSGCLKEKSSILNVTTKKTEKINSVTRLLANQVVPIRSISAGDIGAIIGSK